MTRMENHSQTITLKLNATPVGVLRKVNNSVMRTVDAKKEDRNYSWRRSVGVPEEKDFSQKMVVDELCLSSLPREKAAF